MSLVKRAEPSAPVATEDYGLTASTAAEKSYCAAYESLFPRLCDFAERFLDPDDARDVVQDTMQELWERWPVISMDRPSIAFFFRAVRNRIANARRSGHRERVRLARYLSSLTRRSRRRTRPDALLEQQELAAVLDAAIAGLPARCREVWMLIRENGLTYEEAADAMDVRAVSAKKHMTRAQALLREALSNAGYHDAALPVRRLLPPTSAEVKHD
jgi:RNA polymerase sigma-70 factor (ECF subfamily)